jgi:hypothetical protein
MSKKPALLLRVTDIESVTVSDDPLEGAIIRFSVTDDTNYLEIHLPAVAVVRLQAMLQEADTQQANLTSQH